MDDSFYSQFGDTAPPAQPKEREVGRFANRKDLSKPYVNRMPNHVKEAMTIEQENFSYYEFDNLAFNRNPRDAFGAKVNQAFGKLEKGFDFREEKQRYIQLYKTMMEAL